MVLLVLIDIGNYCYQNFAMNRSIINMSSMNRNISYSLKERQGQQKPAKNCVLSFVLSDFELSMEYPKPLRHFFILLNVLDF